MVEASCQKDVAEPLLRKKREWVIPPKTLWENKDYTHLDFIAKVTHSTAPFLIVTLYTELSTEIARREHVTVVYCYIVILV